MSNRTTKIAVLILLGVLLATAFLSMRGDALTFDELAHIPAGYSYLTQRDFRINPEHPPLVKDLAAIPLLFLNLNFPTDNEAWQQNSGPPPWWVQFNLGTEFLFNSGNNPQQIVFFARLPMLLILLSLALFTFYWARKLGGNLVGLIALFLFSFSPTLIAHGRLITTDIGAALGTIAATYFWIEFLKKPAKGTILKAGIALGIALLLKFSVILLIPFLGILSIVYLIVNNRAKDIAKYLGLSVIIGLIAVIFVIWPVYQLHTLNYPPERQLRDTRADLLPGGITPLEQLTVNISDKPVIRPLAQYARGVLMAAQRSSFGNTTYFLGSISGSGWKQYFPILNIVKVPLAYQFLNVVVLLSLIFAVFFKGIKGAFKTNILKSALNWIKNNFTIFSFILFLNIYWIIATAGNLNIGIRHLIPVFPFGYIMLAWAAKIVIDNLSPKKKMAFIGTLIVLFAWYGGASLMAFPHYISYYNELAGGIENGYKIAVDSNYDWGQDFHRLRQFVEENNITTIHLDYFGGENPEYWLGDKYVKLERKPTTGWIAISVNQLMGGIAKPAPGFDQETGYYSWLSEHEPVARAGKSIFIYYIE